MSGSDWTAARVPPQTGRLALVTGASSGIGYESALALARAGAQVVLASRDPGRGERARAAIERAVPGARVAFRALDTGSLASARGFAASWADDGRPIDLLILNAGIAWTPHRETGADGFERQLATNYLGHFALTGLLMPHLATRARIVPVASLAHRSGRLDFDDLQSERDYSAQGVYRQSKLAMLMFGLELDRRLRAAGSDVRAMPAHPGWATTDIFRRGGHASMLQRVAGRAVFTLVGQSAARGALPLLYAATAPEARGGAYYGPGGWGERRGLPSESDIAPHARDAASSLRLWSTSENLTGVTGWP